MAASIEILYVDDEKGNLETFEYAFGSQFRLKTCESGEEAWKIAETEEIPLLVADQRMPGMSGIELSERFYRSKPDTMRVILTAFKDTQMLLDAIRRGHVHDYIVKPWKKTTLLPILEKAMEDYYQKKSRLKELEARLAKVESLEEEVRRAYDDRGLIGANAGLRDVMDKIRKVAPTDSTVLILGETGTGKELIARHIHQLSGRKKGPFIAVHCAALAKTLLESELFGHEKGAFTGAEQRRVGRFELANRGTIFLDEIGEIPEDIQVKLLRVLQEKEIQRVGGNQVIPVDVRVLAATHKNLKREVQEGRFREDLFYRLNVIPIQVPPLRERKDDIPDLAAFFLSKFSMKSGSRFELSDAARQFLSRYDWPGNVRELENLMERAVILNSGPVIDPEDLGLDCDEILQTSQVDLKNMPAEGTFLQEVHQKQIHELKQALASAKGNISEAARILEMPRSNFFRKLKKYHLV